MRKTRESSFANVRPRYSVLSIGIWSVARVVFVTWTLFVWGNICMLVFREECYYYCKKIQTHDRNRSRGLRKWCWTLKWIKGGKRGRSMWWILFISDDARALSFVECQMSRNRPNRRILPPHIKRNTHVLLARSILVVVIFTFFY